MGNAHKHLFFKKKVKLIIVSMNNSGSIIILSSVDRVFYNDVTLNREIKQCGDDAS